MSSPVQRWETRPVNSVTPAMAKPAWARGCWLSLVLRASARMDTRRTYTGARPGTEGP